MNLTSGEMLFYGGIAGMCIVAVAAIIIILVLGSGKKRLRRKFDTETKSVKK